jgi:hypothetical protein
MLAPQQRHTQLFISEESDYLFQQNIGIVVTNSNPADLARRDVLMNELSENPLW